MMPIEIIAATGYLVHSGALTNAANHAANAAHALGVKAQHALGKGGAKAGAGNGGASASAHIGDAGVSAHAKNGAASITAKAGPHAAHAQAGGPDPASAHAPACAVPMHCGTTPNACGGMMHCAPTPAAAHAPVAP
eukprot:Hpha_TRINITY_DN13064_c0_g1::TRINITY_DN13064_c0_g1_i1::g.68918::m.68918